MDTRSPDDWRSQTPPLSKLTWCLLDLALSPDRASASTLSADEATALRHSLTRLVLDREALAWHIRSLQRLRPMRGSAWPHAWVEPLPQAQVQRVLVEGVMAIEAVALPSVLLNPVALHQVAEAVDEALPDAWLSLMEEHGGELLAAATPPGPPAPPSEPPQRLADAVEHRTLRAAAVSVAQPASFANLAERHFPKERLAWLAACAALLLAACWLGATRVELTHQWAMSPGQFRPSESPPASEPPDLPRAEVENGDGVLVLKEKFFSDPKESNIGSTGEQRLAVDDATRSNLDDISPEKAQKRSDAANPSAEDGQTPGIPTFS